jgi:biopolymer transport protein ExbB
MRKKIYFVLAATFFTALSTSQTWAQTVSDSTGIIQDAKEKSSTTGEKISMLEFVFKGGYFMLPILLLLGYAIFRIFERYRYISRMAKLDPNLLPSVRSSLDKGNVDDALDSAQRSITAHGSVVAEGIQTIGRPSSEIESNMEKVVNIEIAKMERNMGHLGLIAGIAPTFGFIGTIAGVIKIFYNISISADVSISNISGGLYEKMISSGAGLVVGIIAYSGYHLLNGMIDKYALQAQTLNLDFTNILNRPSKWQ